MDRPGAETAAKARTTRVEECIVVVIIVVLGWRDW